MCCRYVLKQEHAGALLAQLGVLLEAGAALPPSRYNIPPGKRIPAVRNLPAGAGREAASLHWGLVPAWARDDSAPVVNARAESLADKPSFRDAVRTRRCLIPASGFYEWKSAGRTREPWFFRLGDEQPFALAGLWESWQSPDGTLLESCAIVTTAANSLMSPVHHRMPVLLADPAAREAWLDSRITSVDTLSRLLAPLDPARMSATPVSPRVNRTDCDDPGCIAPAAEQQLSMGF